MANVFLHYVFGLWVHRWRKQAHGCVSVVRYADDFVMAFKSQADARKMVVELTERLAKFGLALHEEKTRLIMFGKYAAERRLRIGKGRPATFDFLGFTHYCAIRRDGKFIVKRKTQRKRKIRQLKELRIEVRRRMQSPVAKQHEWLSAALRGHFAYYGLPSNMRSMVGFAFEVRRLWLPAQSAWHDMGSVQPLDENLSVADADGHSLNKRKIGARHGLNLGRSRMRERRKSGSVRGAESNLRPYSTMHSNMKPATCSDPKPASVPI